MSSDRQELIDALMKLYTACAKLGPATQSFCQLDKAVKEIEKILKGKE